MTATLIAMLVERGKLGWETTIADVFPDLLNGIQPAFHNLTLIELLSHRAGIPGNDKGQQTYSYMENQLWDLTGPLTQQRRAVVELVLSEPPVSTPGSMFNYSNLGYIIAGAFAEQVTGEQWEQLMQQMLFQPLGMDNSGFGPPGTPGALDEPLGHTSSCQPLQPWSTRPPADNPPVLGPAGTVHSSMSDWARYASLHLLGAQGQRGLLLTPASFQVLHNDQYHQGYALGWFVANRDWAQGLTLSHNGSNTLWYADIWIAPTRNAALMTATNTADCPSQGVGFNACDAAISTMVGIYLQ
jgi:CubicO group peptidase (beta-lactamase class C family)